MEPTSSCTPSAQAGLYVAARMTSSSGMFQEMQIQVTLGYHKDYEKE
jgi:hypothetical protein